MSDGPTIYPDLYPELGHIVITPEMEARGAELLSGYDPAEDSARQFARAIYRVMESARKTEPQDAAGDAISEMVKRLEAIEIAISRQSSPQWPLP